MLAAEKGAAERAAPCSESQHMPCCSCEVHLAWDPGWLDTPGFPYVLINSVKPISWVIVSKSNAQCQNHNMFTCFHFIFHFMSRLNFHYWGNIPYDNPNITLNGSFHFIFYYPNITTIYNLKSFANIRSSERQRCGFVFSTVILYGGGGLRHVI